MPNTCTGHDDIAPILVFTQQGKLIRSIGAGMFVWPHGVAIAKDGTLWISDAVATNGVDKDNPNKGHQVLHLDKNGKILLALGKPGVAGAGHDTFNAPSDVIVAKKGDIFVADGHGPGMNARIVKFDKNGKYITEWGTRGSGPGQFELPHAMAFDSQGRLFVADRNNNRIEIFDQNGKFLTEWKQFGRPSGLAIDKNDTLYVSDTQPTKDRPGFEMASTLEAPRTVKSPASFQKFGRTRAGRGWVRAAPTWKPSASLRTATHFTAVIAAC